MFSSSYKFSVTRPE